MNINTENFVLRLSKDTESARKSIKNLYGEQKIFSYDEAVCIFLSGKLDGFKEASKICISLKKQNEQSQKYK